LGLVQLTRKRLGTGLIEAFSTTCPHCGGRGITLHVDPVDSTSAPSRKSESGGKRGRRSKKTKPDEPAVAKVPVHTHGEHPMFKAMAAANGRHDDETDESARTEDVEETVGAHERGDAETDGQLEEQVAREAAEEDLEDSDFGDGDEDDDEDDVDLDDDEDLDDEDLEDEDDEDDEDLDLDDDLDLEDADDSDNGDDADDSDNGDDADDGGHSDGESAIAAFTAPAAQPRRRRAAARPAGPPIHED
jgi:ribonuclease E